MAAPTIGAIGARLSGAETTTAQVAVPDGVAVDSIVVVMLRRGTASPDAYDPFTSLPSGFQLVSDNPAAAVSAVNTTLDVVWKRATGNDAGTYDFSWTQSQFRTGFALRIDGCRTSGNPFEDDEGAVGGGGTTDAPAVSVTTTGADRLLLWGAATWDSGSWTMPTGFTQQVADAPFNLITCGTKSQAAAGGSGALVGSQPSDSTRAAWVGAFPPSTSSITGSAAATLGALAATASGTLTVTGTATAAFGRLSATATGTPIVTGTAAAVFGRLVAATTGVRATAGSAAATLGGLHGVAATRQPRGTMRLAYRSAPTMRSAV